MNNICRNILYSLAGASALTFSPEVYASYSTSGSIYGISIEAGRVFFYTTGVRSAVPGCSTIPKRWVFNAATAEGQAMLAGLLTFYSTGKAIYVMGTGACTDWSDTETVRYVIRQDEIS